MSRLGAPEFLKRVLFSLAAVVLFWLMAEAVILFDLWLRGRPPSAYSFVFGPHPYRAYAGLPHSRSRDGCISLNSLGLRGPEIEMAKPPNTVRIVCVGGSTTFSDGATTDSNAYPARMERILRERYRHARFRIEVINAGLAAYNSLDSLMLFQTTLLDLSPDIAVAHHGLNDCWFMTEFDNFRSDYSHARQTFALPPPKIWEYSPLLSYLFARDSAVNPYFPPREVVNLNIPIIAQPEAIRHYLGARRREITPAMLAAFERHTRTFVAVARAHDIVPILSTQSTADDTPLGCNWYEQLTKLNEVTRKVAAAERVPLIDFAVLFPYNPVDFYDVMHLVDKPEGLGRMAEIFADAIIRSGAIEWKASQRSRP